MDFVALGSLGRLRKVLLSLCFGLLCSQALPRIWMKRRNCSGPGKYDECAKAVEAGIENDGWSEPWRHLKIKTDLARGRDKEAIAAA